MSRITTTQLSFNKQSVLSIKSSRASTQSNSLLTKRKNMRQSIEQKPETGEIIDHDGEEKIKVDFFDEPHEQILGGILDQLDIDDDFFKWAKPLQIEEIVSVQKFAADTDAFFTEIGLDNIFMMDVENVKDQAIRITLDCIMTRLYQARATIGGYLGDYIGMKRGRAKKDFNEHFTTFARDLAWKLTGADSRGYMEEDEQKIRKLKQTIEDKLDLIMREIMIAFLKESEKELTYLESQIFQVEQALLCKTDYVIKDWTKPKLPNLFSLYLKQLTNIEVGRPEYLEFLRRVVFKIAICCERIEHFVNGVIRARNATLVVFDATIKDSVPDEEKNYFVIQEDGEQQQSRSIDSKDVEEKDILRTYCIQQVIYQQIESHNFSNKGCQILADKLYQELFKILQPFRPRYHEPVESQVFMLLRLTNPQHTERQMSVQHIVNPHIQTFDREVNVANQANSNYNPRVIFNSVKNMTRPVKIQNAGEKLLPRLFELLSKSEATQESAESVFKSICLILNELRGNKDQKHHDRSTLKTLLKNRNNNLAFQSLYPKLLEPIMSMTSMKLATDETSIYCLSAFPSLLWFLSVMEVKGLIKENSVNHISINKLVLKVKNAVFDPQVDVEAEYFSKQIYFKNLPEVFEIVAMDFFFRQKLVTEQTRQNFYTILRSLWTEDLDSSSESGRQQLSIEQNTFLDLAQNKYMLSEPARLQNSNVTRLLAMAEILTSSAMMRLESFVQNNLVLEFSKYLSIQVQDLRRRGQNSNLRKPANGFAISEEQMNSKESLLYGNIYFFLQSYLKWESNFYRNLHGQKLETIQQASQKQEESKSYLNQDIDQYVHMMVLMKNTNIRSQEKPLLLEQSHRCIKSQIELNYVVMFRLLAEFNRENMQGLFEKRGDANSKQLTTRKNLIKMLSTLQKILYKNEIEFQDPFESYGRETRYTLFQNFCTELCYLLIKRQHSLQSLQTKEYRPLFAQTWFIMLSNYIDKRDGEIKQIKNENRYLSAGQAMITETESSYKKGTGKLFRNMLFFCKEAVSCGGNRLLIPSNDLVKMLTSHYIPKMTSLVRLEAEFKSHFTLDDLLQFLILYEKITFEKRLKNPRDVELIDTLPILVKISQDLLKTSKEYKAFAQEPSNFLVCDTCQEEEAMGGTGIKRWSKGEYQKQSLLVQKIGENASKLIVFVMDKEPVMRPEQWQEVEDQGVTFDYCNKLCRKFQKIEQRIFLESYSQSLNIPFYSAYCKYMLLSTKIRKNVFESPSEIIPVANECQNSLANLTNVIPLEERQTFLVVEQAFLQQETQMAIMKLLESNKGRFDVLTTFAPGYDFEVQIDRLVGDMSQCHFPLQAIQAKQTQLSKILHQDAAFNQSKKIRQENIDEVTQIKDVLKSMMNHATSACQYQFPDNIVLQAQRPELCHYVHIRFFGRHFPSELTHNKHGFIMRRRFGSDFLQLKGELDALFNFADGTQISYELPANTSNQVEGNPKHDQDRPVIALIPKNLEILTEATRKLYQPEFDQEEIKTQPAGLNSDGSARKNFKEFFDCNFKKYFYTKTQKVNEKLKAHCFARIVQELKDHIREDSGELDLDQVQITLEQGTNFFTTLQKLKAMVTTPKDFKKFWNKACKLANKPEGVEVLSAKYVIQSAQNDWAEERLFQDSVINILEVPEEFPAGFYMQPVVKNREWVISSAKKENDMVQEEWISKLEALTQNNDAENDKNLASELWRKIWPLLSADIGGGAKRPIQQFFTENGYHQLNNSNEQFRSILQLFTSLEKLVYLFQKSVNILTNYLKKGNEQDEVNQFGVDTLQDLVKKYAEKFEEIRRKQNIDDLMAEERDNMDIDDEDW